MKRILFIITLFFSSIFLHSQEIIKGYVYEDINGNGKKDRRETGIPNVSVSNDTDVVVTDSKGFYTLPISNGNTISVIKPAGYQTPVDEDYIPRFYYHHKPSGFPDSFKFEGVSPTGDLPKSVDFVLYKKDEPENFTVVVFGDPQPYSMQDMDYFTEKIVKDVKKTDKTLFGISLGDIAGDNPDLHPVYKERMRHLQLPWYNVMGNHDMNYETSYKSNKYL